MLNPRNMSSRIIIACLSLALLFSCKGNDDDENLNIVKFGNEQFKLYRGYSHKFSDALPTGATPYVLALLGEGVSYSTDAGKFTGTGALITAYFYSENSAEIKNGLYTVDIFSQKGSFTVDSCKVFYNYDFAADTGRVYSIKAGTFDVYNLGRLMRYKIDIQTADFIHFVGDFKGTIDPM